MNVEISIEGSVVIQRLLYTYVEISIKGSIVLLFNIQRLSSSTTLPIRTIL